MKTREIDLLKQKDEGTFDKFYNKYFRLFFTIIYNIIKDFSTTETLVADTFCKIIEDLHQYRGGNFKYWCITIAKNIANSHLRKVIRERETMVKYQAELLNNEENTENNKENIEQLLLAIKKIVDQTTYEIIILHLVYKLKFKDIAEINQTTTSTIIGKYHRGIKKIRSMIDHEDYQ